MLGFFFRNEIARQPPQFLPVSKDVSNQFQPSNPKCFPTQPESQPPPLAKRSNSIDDVAELSVRLRTRQTLCSKCKGTEVVPGPETPKKLEPKKRPPSAEPEEQPSVKKPKEVPSPSSSKASGKATQNQTTQAADKPARKPIKVLSGSITEVYDPSPCPAPGIVKVKEEKTRMFTLVPKLERLDLEKYKHLLHTPVVTVSDSESEEDQTATEKNTLKLTISKSKISGCYVTDSKSGKGGAEPAPTGLEDKTGEKSNAMAISSPKSNQSAIPSKPGRMFRLLNAPKRMQSPGRPSPRREIMVNQSPSPHAGFLDDIMERPTEPLTKKSKKRPAASTPEEERRKETESLISEKAIPVLKIKLPATEPEPRTASPLLADPTDEIEILEESPSNNKKEVEFIDLTEANDENVHKIHHQMSPKPGPSQSPSARAAKKALKKARKESQRKISTPQSRSPFGRSPGHRWACSPLPSPMRSPFGNYTPHRNSPVYLGNAYQSPDRCSPNLYTLKSVSETTLVVKKGAGKKKGQRQRELRARAGANTENEYQEPLNGRREINQFALRNGTMFYRGTIVWAKSLQGSWWPGKVS